MDQERKDKLFRAAGHIKDTMVNAAFDKADSLASKVAKNKKI